MFKDTHIYQQQFEEIIESGAVQISNIKPSDWVEQNVIMGKPFPGPFKYNRTPYSREIIDCFAPDHPMKWIAIKKGAQIGLSAGVIIPILLWMIKNDPSNTYFLVGSPNLVEKATEKLDIGIDNASLRPYIKPQVMRRRAQKSGDTNNKKEFSGGYIHIGSANNHKDIRDVSLKYGLFDDWEAVKRQSKESGSTRKKLEQRFAAYADTHKIGYISTPELEEGSNIDEAYLLGDQRKYLTPCPCCGEFIEWKWTVTEGEITGGIIWDEDPETHKLIQGSVRYKCQKCGGEFDDKNKHELLNMGYWQPTAAPSQPGYYSYHISSLYAPIGMYDWEHYVNDWLVANPYGQPRNEALCKQFVNEVLGECYVDSGESPKSTQIMQNIRSYPILTIPEKQSIADGNGKIVLLTCSADMNGKMAGFHKATEDDVRLDWEILAHAESGATYSISHGSIGTFTSGIDPKTDRIKWTYEENKPYCVWPELDKIIGQQLITDTGRGMKVFLTGLDTGNYTTHAYNFLNKRKGHVVGLKGEKEEEYARFDIDKALFKPSVERPHDLFILQVGKIKDNLSSYMSLRWHEGEAQPANFMNYPQPSEGRYGYSNYFQHYEAEARMEVKKPDGKVLFIWKKIKSNNQNHFWDCRVYNLALRDISMHLIAKELKKKDFTWQDYVAMVTGGK